MNAALLIITLTMFSIDGLAMSCHTLLAIHLRRWLHELKVLKLQNRFFGSIFIGARMQLASSR